MKSIFVLLGSGLLATTLAAAQDLPANSSDGTARQSSQSYQTSKGVIRGCLSGSAGNYTITDQNGMQYQINGPDNQLQASVGHEVEVTTRQDQTSATSTQGDQTTSSTTNSVQVSNIHDVASTCTKGNSSSTPKGTPDAAEPPQPQTMAMLQQESKPDMGANPQQTTPPVTSQTPATPGASTNSAQQATAPSSSTTTSTTTTTNQQSTTPSNTNGMTGSQVDQNAQSARQGEMNSNPNAATTNGATPSSSATPGASPSNAQQPNANDQNKPLYERQATDIPWANHSGDNNSGNTGTSNTPPQQ